MVSNALWPKNAGRTSQKPTDKVFKKHIKYCRSYMDDVTIFSRKWEEHLDHFKQIFQIMRYAY